MQSILDLPQVLFVTGTDTGVGKTITTAALAAVLARTGSVAVYKPVQTGAAVDEAADIAEVARLSGVESVFEGVRYSAPMAPVAAAALEGRELPMLAVHAREIVALRQRFDWVLVEGSGGVLVDLDDDGGTLADLAAGFAAVAEADKARQPAVLVVARAGLGTLNHTALTIEALRRRGVVHINLILGSVSRAPDAIEQSNREVFAAGRNLLLGQIPASAAKTEPATFREAARHWFDTAAKQPG